MSLRVTFLGTAGSIPTPQRSLPAIVVQRNDELFLFDCGEGVQRQMIKAGVSLHRRMRILITHMHGDHLLGLPGLLQTMSLLERKRKLRVYGPSGLRAFIEAVKQTVPFGQTFPLEVIEIEDEGEVCAGKGYMVHAVRAEHLIPNLAYGLVEKPRPGKFYPEKAESLGVPKGQLWSRLQHNSAIKLPDGRTIKPEEVLGSSRPGRKLVYTGDTKPSEAIIELANGADLLIHEATFDDELGERAEEDGHSTPSQAAEIARKCKSKWLILTHISARYKAANLLLAQAKKKFPHVEVAEDFMRIDLPLTDV
ncbi:MAG: ribonuclease Z [Candidatus Bathyarchaeota archaeon]|nr:MAG: ribonuclease Z [Candidatus Bathyarchaeota archaeon]